MIDFIKTKRTYIIALAVLFVFVSLSDTTYSLFLKSDTTDEFNYNTGILDLKFIEGEQILLQDAFPMNDSEGIKQTPYTLTIKNTGSLIYLFDLNMVNSSDTNSISTNYIKVKVNDYLPHNLASTNSRLASNIILYPNEEITFKINVWLDIDAPNNELGKIFNAKVVTSGSAIYKTLDKSGANHPKLNNDMLPVYYNETEKVWQLADSSNTNNDYNWYNYDEQKWANSVTIKDSNKKIYDITGNHNLNITDLSFNNGNAIIDDKYLDLNITNYKYQNISNIIRVKINDLSTNTYFISNDKVSYYYNPYNQTFTFKNGNSTVSSSQYQLEENTWYIIGYTYDGNNVSFYVNGIKLSSSNISGSLSSSTSFKIGTDSNATQASKMTIGDILFYNRILSDNEISTNYKTSMSIVTDGLLYGYREFTPMTLKEYYLSSNLGTIISNDDILSQYVWIPRFKYKVWNVLGEDNTDIYDAYHKGIDIAFENLNSSSGTIYCENTNCYSDSAKTISVTSDDNGKYYTHPAFDTTTEKLYGMWIGKYEISNDNEIKMGNNILTNTNLSTYYNQVKSISDNNNYHIIKNTEWGALTYLTHSKYGLCQNNTCKEIGTNNSYISGNQITDSTTGNIYGIFDTSGNANEYTMANITTTGSLNLNNSFFNGTPLGTDDYDLYQENTFILGDATNELSLGNTNWYNTNNKIFLQSNWIIRSNLYGYNTSNDIEANNITTRIVIK